METVSRVNQEIQKIVTHMQARTIKSSTLPCLVTVAWSCSVLTTTTAGAVQMSGQQMTPEMEEPLKKMVESETSKVSQNAKLY